MAIDYAILKVFDALAITGAGTYTSKTLAVGPLTLVGFDIEISAGITGTLTVNAFNGGTPKSFTLTNPPPAIGGSAIGFLLEILDFSFSNVQLVLTVSSGTGTISAGATAKKAG